MTSSSPKIAFTVAETARLLSLTPWQVYQAVQSGALSAHRLDRRLLITDTDLRAWLETLRVEAVTA